MEELSAGVEDVEQLAVRDHLRPRSGWEVDDVLAELRRLTPEELLDLAAVAKAIDLTGEPEALDAPRTRAATACWPGCRSCRRRWSNGWSSASACSR